MTAPTVKQILDTTLMLAPFVEKLVGHIYGDDPPPMGYAALPSTLKSEVSLKRAEERAKRAKR